jgi:hypothetical protein
MDEQSFDVGLYDSVGNVRMQEPVFLSGGELGGHIVDGIGWELETERLFVGRRYRRVERQTEPQNVSQAVFCGALPN